MLFNRITRVVWSSWNESSFIHVDASEPTVFLGQWLGHFFFMQTEQRHLVGPAVELNTPWNQPVTSRLLAWFSDVDDHYALNASNVSARSSRLFIYFMKLLAKCFLSMLFPTGQPETHNDKRRCLDRKSSSFQSSQRLFDPVLSGSMIMLAAFEFRPGKKTPLLLHESVVSSIITYNSSSCMYYSLQFFSHPTNLTNTW